MIKVVLSVRFAETRCVPEISALALTMSGPPPITSSFSNVRVLDRSLEQDSLLATMIREKFIGFSFILFLDQNLQLCVHAGAITRAKIRNDRHGN